MKWVVALVLALPILLALAYGLLSRALWAPGPGATATALALSRQPRPAEPGAPGAGSARPPAAPVTSGAPPAAAPRASGAMPGTTVGEFEQLADRLAQRLQAQPNDPVGWNTLAHTYYVLKRFPDAAQAYERLVTISTPDAETLADYADALAMAQGRSLEGKPMELVRRALELDPSQWKALSMAATYAFERQDYASAIEHWERALAGAQPGSDLARSIEANIAQARTLSASK
ncbi:MAG: hypothetical protein JSW68_13335 [Burkholderiales bacterium]|nr:MAG: hypothetical protein JSW68_13335 [Burkholderiales bacterium]